LIDRFGGHVVMPFGSLTGALGLVALVQAQSALAYFAAWMICGAAMAASLYDPAFATLGRLFGAAARQPITILTLAGGFASTVSWPATQALIAASGWRGTYLVYAALLAFVAAPLHAFALPRWRASTDMAAATTSAPMPVAKLAPHGWPFVLVAAAFAAYAFVPSALSAHLLAIFERFGIAPATVVLIGMMFGPSQVVARVGELVFARDVHPLWVARVAVGMLVAGFVLLAALPFSVPLAAAFAVLFGMANGLITIARGTVPLALFGASGYGLLVGRIAGPFLVMQSIAPLVLAYVAERFSDAAALALVAAFALAALASFMAIRRPG
jgi:hypothetical protein